MKEQGVVIFGAGGHGRVVLDILLESGDSILGFLDNDETKTGQDIRGYKVLGDWSFIRKKSQIRLALGIGDNRLREKIFRTAKNKGIKMVSAIHPRAIVSKDISIGEGVVIMPGVVVNPGTVLEEGVVVNTGATVDHDCHLGRFCQVWPGAHLAGTVRVGEFSYVGTGAAVVQDINIGRNAMVGAGAVILSDVPENTTVVGNPGKVIKTNG